MARKILYTHFCIDGFGSDALPEPMGVQDVRKHLRMEFPEYVGRDLVLLAEDGETKRLSL